MADRAIASFADPMCSWCSGFSPSIADGIAGWLARRDAATPAGAACDVDRGAC